MDIYQKYSTLTALAVNGGGEYFLTVVKYLEIMELRRVSRRQTKVPRRRVASARLDHENQGPPWQAYFTYLMHRIPPALQDLQQPLSDIQNRGHLADQRGAGHMHLQKVFAIGYQRFCSRNEACLSLNYWPWQLQPILRLEHRV